MNARWGYVGAVLIGVAVCLAVVSIGIAFGWNLAVAS